MIPKARQVRIAIFDVDGVLSDGGLHYAEAGDAMKTFDVRDGMGMKLLQDSGVELAIITSRRAGSVRERAADLGIRHVQQGVADKYSAFEELLAGLGLTAEQSAFLGDDLVDLPVLRRCGFAVTVADAPAVLKRHADYVTRATGGRGAARELCEVILHNQGALTAQTARFLGSP
jgi:3-deoxy-D-manno-octulosonate 8-phosphate phosphatase (KDO 8-P phosphatase)